MEWLEMHNVEYGECVVLGGKKGDILMVDCGSMNVKIRENDLLFTDYITEYLMPRYADAVERQFLLTHFHLDHLSGFRQILKERPMYFHRIFLPVSPADRYGRPLLIEFALYVFAFLGGQSDYARMSISALRIFEKLRGICGTDSLFTLARGASFRFDDSDYDVLWPPAEEYSFPELFASAVDDLDVCLSSPF
jgi:glyoxylase-like metal-dependent hydrolase (beta-lactamase superfamily II)